MNYGGADFVRSHSRKSSGIAVIASNMIGAETAPTMLPPPTMRRIAPITVKANAMVRTRQNQEGRGSFAGIGIALIPPVPQWLSPHGSTSSPTISGGLTHGSCPCSPASGVDIFANSRIGFAQIAERGLDDPSMWTIEIRRHSFTKKGEGRGRGSHLSHEGVLAARELGRSAGPFDYVMASTSPRTTETAIAMGVAVDDLIEMPSPVETGEIEFHSWREWADPFTTFRDRARESPALNSYMTTQVDRLLAGTRVVGEGRALVVGHGGWIESVVAGVLDSAAASKVGGSFWHLDGIRLIVDPGTSPVSVESVDRYPR